MKHAQQPNKPMRERLSLSLNAGKTSITVIGCLRQE